MKDEIILNVPYKEKEEAKLLGAQWDPGIRKWYVPAHLNVRPFARWINDRIATGKDDQHRNSKEKQLES